MTLSFLGTFNPIFIVGNSRSGTTLLGRILGNSSDVLTFEELHFFEGIWTPNSDINIVSFEQAVILAATLLNIQRNDYLTQQDINLYKEEAKMIVQELPEPFSPPLIFSEFLKYESRLRHKQRPCEQTPRNVLYIGEILNLYPNARVINMIRDPRDTLLSQKRKWRRSFASTNQPKLQAIRYWMNYHPFTMSKLWRLNILAAEKYEKDERVLFMKFEDLLSNPEFHIKRICEFIDISFDVNLLNVPRIGSSSEPDQHDSKGINQNRKETWRKGGLGSSEIFICQKINQDLISKYSYQFDDIFPNVFSLALSTLFFPLKLTLALFLSLNRIKNIRTAIARRLA